MTVAPLARVPAAPCPLRDPPIPAPRRPTVRVPGHEPAALPTGRGNPHERHTPTSEPERGPGPVHGSAGSPRTPAVAGERAGSPQQAGDRPDEADGHPGADAPAARPPHTRAAALVRSMVEVLAGRRQPAQLAAAVTPEVLRYLSASRPAAVRTAGAGRVHVRQPHPGAAEVVAVCRIGDRTRALALRLDLDPGTGDRERRWTCTAVRLL